MAASSLYVYIYVYGWQNFLEICHRHTHPHTPTHSHTLSVTLAQHESLQFVRFVCVISNARLRLKVLRHLTA